MTKPESKLLAEVESAREQFQAEIGRVASRNDLEALRIRYLGRKGLVSRFFSQLAGLEPGDRPAVGKAINELRALVSGELEKKRREIEFQARRETIFDPSLPGTLFQRGRKHPLLQVLDEIVDIFTSLGFSVETGPEIETDYYNFEALNIPPDHPSRDLQDTFYLESPYLLRTHTSPVQIRAMEKQRPPVRMIAPGRCFRKDTPDATHSPMFHQIEGLCVDKGVTFAHLKGVILTFAQKLFGKEVRIRFRPSFFPFTEPSAEYDFSCIMCKGEGCRVCKYTGWLEISGAGMVDPAVFGFVDYDPEEYTGYAFGMGVERIAMLKFQIGDIRLFYENDLRFLSQF
ncbi:MAG: phenylalanine--tRNA ligase subunit alpha [candidate division KSB1 bacterium]|nr:phenylalanine--tRNA ligase subunit alpha [candidate division KSB1 bacterium]